MRYRVLPSGKGLVLILLLPWSFLGGQALGQPLLNLVGYLLAVVLAFSLILGILSRP